VVSLARRRRSGSHERGQALLLVALVLLLVMLGIGLVDGALVARLRATRDESLRVEIEALADAAMAEALANLAAATDYAGAPPHGFARGLISSRIVALAGSRYEVTASAALAGRTRSLRAEVDLPWGRPIVLSWRVLPKETD
jgi:hypothetical protein